jgi:hypothetical protein
MAGTYDADTIRAVRLFIPDVEAIYGAGGNENLFEDLDIAIFLDQAQGNAMWAAGIAMIAVGNSEALIGKVIRNYETETDASKLQREWRAAGVEMIKAGREIAAEDAGGIFETAYPDWEGIRHPEGQSHGGYRGLAPTNWQW